MIHPTAEIDSVHLTIADLDRSLRFYQEHLGFKVHRRDRSSAALGTGPSTALRAGARDLLVLHESTTAPRPHRTTGLYHFAILVPSRLELARSLARLAALRTPMQGFADHLVSEAIYLADPDGNGIEVYRDRPRAEWPTTNGQLRMTSDPLDVDGLLREAEVDATGPDASPWAGLAAGTRIGHMHLHVSFLEDTEAFYGNVLGFTLTQRLAGSALFFAAGDYHHHVAANTWAGVGAPRPPAGAIGLRHFVVRLPDQAAVDDVAARVREAGLKAEIEAGTITVPDPSGNLIVLTARA